jgi:hypothetical protein
MRFIDFCDRWSRRLAYVAIILALIVIIIPAALNTCTGAKSVPIREMTPEKKQENKRLRKKHDQAVIVTCDYSHTTQQFSNCYFVRDGKKCRWM